MLDAQDSVSLVALIVSVIALVGTVLQLLQQYYASAEGYSNCGQRVMGPWSSTRRRKFRWTELRFEVQFEAPVVFVCPPTNERGPVPNQPLLFVDGSRESEDRTRIPSLETEKDQKDHMQDSKKRNRDVHTADNERANWFILLQAFHRMERESQAWSQGILKGEAGALGPKLADALPSGVAPWATYSSVLALQPKRRSWDTMPAEVKKPYATSTICHIVEMAAMLGLHWREFDRSAHRYHAEGNGYLLTGRAIADLGIMFSFQIYAKNKFDKNRIIPSDDIKLLCFGNIPTIFRDTKADYDNDDPKATGVIQLGSTAELIESLAHYGCNSKTTNYFRDERKYRLGHLYPIAFELVGMVATSMYIPQTYYRFLPNPTTFSWNRKNFSLRKLILEFTEFVGNDDMITMRTSHIFELSQWCYDLQLHLVKWKNEDVFSMALLQALHDAVRRCDEYLTRHEKLAKLVIREHVQEVMRLLNEGGSHHTSLPPPPLSLTQDERDDSTTTTLSPADSRTRRVFDELNSAGPEERQNKLVDIYFSMVLPAVTRKCHESLLKQKDTTVIQTPDNRSAIDLSAADAAAAEASRLAVTPPAAPAEAAAPLSSNSSSSNSLSPPKKPRFLVSKAESGESTFKLTRMPTLEHEVLTEEVWCTLVLRMFCWLLLHDFHKKDVQIPKSELYDSRLPVYIA